MIRLSLPPVIVGPVPRLVVVSWPCEAVVVPEFPPPEDEAVTFCVVLVEPGAKTLVSRLRETMV